MNDVSETASETKSTRSVFLHRLKDSAVVLGIGFLIYALLSLWSLPQLHPSVWEEVAVAAGLRPPANPFPGLYRILLRTLFLCVKPDVALDVLPHLGRIAISVAAMFVYLVFRDILPAILRIKAHMERIGSYLGRMCAGMGALLFVCSDPVWRAGQTFSPVSLFILFVTLAGYLFFRFVRLGSIPSLYSCCAVVGCISAESTIGFLMAFFIAFGVLLAVRWANDPEVPLVNPLVDALVREVVFKRLTYVWAFFFVLCVGVNVWNFISQGGMDATGRAGVLGLLFEYFRGGYEATRDAAMGSGWLFMTVLSVVPFVFAIKLLPRAWDDDKFLPWAVGVVYLVIGVAALSQLSAADVLWFWTWLGPGRDMVSSDCLLSFVLIFDVAVVVFALVVFGVDAICRNYRRIAKQKYPESMLETVPAQMAESLGRARILRKRFFWTAMLVTPIVVVPGRMMSIERSMMSLVADAVDETLKEAEGCETIFTDGSFDCLLELEALRKGRSLVCLSLMENNTVYARKVRARAVKDDEDKALLETDAASALRSWVATKPERLNKCAVQIGFEMWHRVKKSLPPCLGFIALPGGVTDEERARALQASEVIGDAAYELADKHDVDEVPDREIRRKFPFVLWRLSRLAYMRSRIADEAGDREEAMREAAKADQLDSVNAQVQKMRNDMNWISRQNGGQLSPREGLVIGLSRADFALAGRYAAPVLKADPDDPRANFALGMMFLQEKQLSRAEQHLARCLKTRPNEPAVLNNLAIVQTKLGKFDEAEAHVKRAIEKHPNLVELKKTLANIEKARTKKKAQQAE